MAIKVIGHRGARGILPELSLAGFNKALSLGVWGIELDVGVSTDRQVVVYHDYSLNPDITRDLDGEWLSGDRPLICNLSLDELRQFDIGRINPNSDYAKLFPKQLPVDSSRIPTLVEVVELIRQHTAEVFLCIEAKRSPLFEDYTLDLKTFTDAIINEVKQLDIVNSAIVQSFDWNVLRYIRAHAPEIKVWHLSAQLTGYSTMTDARWTNGLAYEDFHNCTPLMVQADGGDVWSCNYEILTKQLVNMAHELGQKVYVWTVNEDNDFREMMEMGVDGITTDYPDRLIDFLSRES